MSSPRRRRIAHVVRQYAPSIGGLEAYVEQLARRQNEHSDVEILTLNRVFDVNERLPAHEVRDGVSVRRVPFVGHRKLFFPILEPGYFKQFDVIHIHAADQLLDLSSYFARKYRIPYFVVSHGLFFHTKDYIHAKHFYLKNVTKLALMNANAVFAVSANDQGVMRQVGVDSILLRNPIEPYPFHEVWGDDLLFVGRLSKNKRVDKLIEFFAALRRWLPSSRLHIVGSDTEGFTPGLQRLAESCAVSEQVAFHGYLDRDSLLALLPTCGYTVSASEYEGFGLSVVEAMSAGLVPFLQRNAAFEETHLRSGVGAMASFDDPEDAARQFMAMRERVTYLDRRAAREFGLSHSWESVEATIQQQYDLALAAAGPAVPETNQ